MLPFRLLNIATTLRRPDAIAAVTDADWHQVGTELETHASQLADLRRALRAYDLAGPLTENRRQAMGEILTLARQLTEE